MNDISFSAEAWDDYLYWQSHEKKTVVKINQLLKDIQRQGLSDCIGKPEPLKHRKAWSRRIDHENRLIYNLDEKHNILIISCKGHYED